MKAAQWALNHTADMNTLPPGKNCIEVQTVFTNKIRMIDCSIRVVDFHML